MSKKNGKALKPQATENQDIFSNLKSDICTGNASKHDPSSTLEMVALSLGVEIQPKEVSSVVDVCVASQPIESDEDVVNPPSVKGRRSSLQVAIERRDKIAKSIRQLLAQERATNRKLEAQRKMVYGTILDRLIADGSISIDFLEQNIFQYLLSQKERKIFEEHLVQARKN